VSLLVVDTDVASAILKRRVPPRLAARLAGQTICVTFVTVGELVKWTEVRSWGPRKLGDLAAWFDRVVVLPYDDAVATTWGKLQARAQRRGRPRPANDTWVAACCLVDELPLATFNTKDYADFAVHDELHLLDLS
jgi:predicted nucleic acid-binding protein